MNTQPPQVFFDNLPTQSNQELFDVLAHSQDYLPAAREAVMLEIHRRGIENDANIKISELLEKESELNINNLNESLSIGMKVFAATLCPIFIIIILSFYYTINNRKTKSKEIKLYYLISVCWKSFVLFLFLVFKH